jgi:Mrp family chromosome partitioning ATPase
MEIESEILVVIIASMASLIIGIINIIFNQKIYVRQNKIELKKTKIDLFENRRQKLETYKFEISNRESEVQEFNNSSTRTIAIASGKGGVGKSTFTVNFAYNLRKLNKKVLIIDSDIGMANLDIMLGVQPNYDMGHLLRGECSLEDAVIEGPAGIKLLSGITGDDSFIDIQNDAMEKLIELGDQIEKNYDYLLIDLGAGAAKNIVNTILAA